MASPLTAGFCQIVFEATDTPEDMNPIVQILNVKKINAAGASGADRYRIILSDGTYFIQSMLATQLNHMVESKQLDKNVVVKLTQFVVNSVQSRKLVIILGLEVQAWNGDKIGEPKNVEGAAPAAAAPAAAAPPPPVGSAAVLRGNGSAAGGGRGGAPARKAAGGKDAMGPLYPIDALSPYQNKWTIKARVTQKSDIKHWSNQRGEGKLFSVTFMDETGEIRATGFNEAVDNFYDLLEEGKVFFVSRARVNLAKKQFSNVNNDYEIQFERDTEIEAVKYNFRKIGELGEEQKDAIIDVIGIVKETMELGSVTSKATNKPFSKRDIQLVDDSKSGQSVRLTLWGKIAETFIQPADEPVIAFKGVKVGDFGGRSLSMFSSATMSVNPDIPEAHALLGWWGNKGKTMQFQAYTNASSTRADSGAFPPNQVKNIGQVKDEQLGMSDKTEHFDTSGTIAFIRQENFAYPACANPDGCNKKVIDNGDKWTCEKCNKDWDKPIYRYILSMHVMDYTGAFWITAFNEVAEQVMGVSANELHELRGENEPDFNRYFLNASGKTWMFSMMAKQDSYNLSPRPPTTPIRTSSESVILASQISSLSMGH